MSTTIIKVCPRPEELSAAVQRDIPCEIEGCDKVLPQRSAYRMHLSQVHKIERESTQEELARKMIKGCLVEYHCPADKCVYHIGSVRYFSNLQGLKQHYKCMHAEKNYECEKCQRRFGLEKSLRDHMKGCGLIHMCQTCGSPYSTRQAVLTHCNRSGHLPPDKPSELSGNKMTMEQHRKIVAELKAKQESRIANNEVNSCGGSNISGLGVAGNSHASVGQANVSDSANTTGWNTNTNECETDTGCLTADRSKVAELNGLRSPNTQTVSSKSTKSLPNVIKSNKLHFNANGATAPGTVTVCTSGNPSPTVGKLLLPKSIAMLLPVEFRTAGAQAIAVPAQPGAIICITNNNNAIHPRLINSQREIRPKAPTQPVRVDQGIQFCNRDLNIHNEMGSQTVNLMPSTGWQPAESTQLQIRGQSQLGSHELHHQQLQKGQKSIKSVAGTQTTGDYILKKAMQSADIPIQRESRGSQVSPRAKLKRAYETQQSTETQTSESPVVKKRPKVQIESFHGQIKGVNISIEEINYLDTSHNETQTIDMWEDLENNLAESISTQTLESFLMSSQSSILEFSNMKTNEQCIQTHDSFIQLLEETSSKDPLLSSTVCEKDRQRNYPTSGPSNVLKQSSAFGTDVRSNVRSEKQDANIGPDISEEIDTSIYLNKAESSENLAPKSVSKSTSTNTGMSTYDSFDALAEYSEQVSLPLWNPEDVLNDKDPVTSQVIYNQTGESTSQSSACTDRAHHSKNNINAPPSQAQNQADEGSTESFNITNVSSHIAMQITSTPEENKAISTQKQSSYFSVEFETSVSTQTMPENCTQSQTEGISGTGTVLRSTSLTQSGRSLGHSFSCPSISTQTMENPNYSLDQNESFFRNFNNVQSISWTQTDGTSGTQNIINFFEHSNMETQTVEDIFHQFLSNMETQTSADDLLESLGFSTTETQTNMQYDSLNVETQTNFHNQSWNDSLGEQADMMTQTVWEDLEDLIANYSK